MNRSDKGEFVKKLTELKDFAAFNGNVITKEQIREQFTGIELNEAQFELITEYLKSARIGVDEPVNTDEFLTGEDKSYLDMYLDELKAYPPLPEGRKRALLMAVMAGDMSDKDELIISYLPKVLEIARLYVGQGITLEDLIGEGNVALTVLMDMLLSQDDPDEADEMIHHMIMQAMEELIVENDSSKGEFEVWADKANEVLDKARELSEELLRKVTVDELCAEAGFEKAFVEKVLEVTGGKIEYIEQ